MDNHLTPYAVVERLIGRAEVIGPAMGMHPKAPYVWRNASAWRDAGDIPSARHMRRLLAWSAARGLGLTAEHLIWGAPAAEIEAILAGRGAAPEAALPAEPPAAVFASCRVEAAE